MAFKGRISFAHLPSERPIHDIQRLPLTEFLLWPAEVVELKQHYSILLLRVLCDNISFLKPFQKFVPNHILHEYSVEMYRKAEERSLGLVFENENTTDGMAKILEHLHEYVPNDVNKVVWWWSANLWASYWCTKTETNRKNTTWEAGWVSTNSRKLAC